MGGRVDVRRSPGLREAGNAASRRTSRSKPVWPVRIRSALRRGIRPSRTHGTRVLWAKSLLNAALFFAVFLLALPWWADRLLPEGPSLPALVRNGLAPALAGVGLVVWIACLDAFSRRGGGTPLAVDAPRSLVTTGLFAVLRNPIMLAELSIVWAEFLHFESWGIAIYAALLTGAAHLLVVHVEEPELRSRFGEAYVAYCGQVPRWRPRLFGRRLGA